MSPTPSDMAAANESIRLALESTPDSHPDKPEIERMADTFEKP